MSDLSPVGEATRQLVGAIIKNSEGPVELGTHLTKAFISAFIGVAMMVNDKKFAEVCVETVLNVLRSDHGAELFADATTSFEIFKLVEGRDGS